jgi:hypothetical protein
VINATAQTTGTYYVVGVSATGSNVTPSAVTATPINFNAANGTLNAVIFNATSDINRKTNITKIETAIEIITKLDGVEFDWIDNGNKSSGVIAQQIEPILPHLVSTSGNGDKSVNYAGITA